MNLLGRTKKTAVDLNPDKTGTIVIGQQPLGAGSEVIVRFISPNNKAQDLYEALSKPKEFTFQLILRRNKKARTSTGTPQEG
jgi:hypothetical protein